jgi:hypothetical protein
MESKIASINGTNFRNGEKKMTRNFEIQRIFENADESLQGVLGHHFYVLALYQSVDDLNRIRKNLPNVSDKLTVDAFPMTFSWIRYYRKEELINTYMSPFFVLYQSRVTLTGIVSVFDDFLNKVIIKLNCLGHKPTLEGKEYNEKNNKWRYKQKIKWAFFESRDCKIGDLEAIKRLPKTFGIIDEARRLRNLIMHNHGIFDEIYGREAKEVNDFEKYVHPDYKDSSNNIPVILNHSDIVNISMAHIEVLHILHNQIQKKFFNHPKAYDYREERKLIIKWNLAFWGNAKVDKWKESSHRESYLGI